MAVKLGDVVFRRTDLATGKDPGEEALRSCAELMAAELGWDNNKTESELDEVRSMLTRISVPSQEETKENTTASVRP